MLRSSLKLLTLLALIFLLSAIVLHHDSAAKKAKSKITTLPSLLVPEVLRFLPHLRPGHTQGLLFAGGSLFESVGLYGQSEVREIDAKTGELCARHQNNNFEFGEGLALHGDTLIQLTWREGYALRLTRVGLTVETPWSYSGEGWGLTWVSDTQTFFRSDGTSLLHIHNATNFGKEGTLEVKRVGVALKNLNELEYAQGTIYANLYGATAKDQYIIAIDPHSGDVTAEIDFRTLCQEEGIAVGRELNGIAYDPDEDVFYITGKHWEKIYVVRW